MPGSGLDTMEDAEEVENTASKELTQLGRDRT